MATSLCLKLYAPDPQESGAPDFQYIFDMWSSALPGCYRRPHRGDMLRHRIAVLSWFEK